MTDPNASSRETYPDLNDPRFDSAIPKYGFFGILICLFVSGMGLLYGITMLNSNPQAGALGLIASALASGFVTRAGLAWRGVNR